MTKKRTTHSPEFKARVALEGIKPIHEIASDNEIHPVQISEWKKELQEQMSEIFVRKKGRQRETDEEVTHRSGPPPVQCASADRPGAGQPKPPASKGPRGDRR